VSCAATAAAFDFPISTVPQIVRQDTAAAIGLLKQSLDTFGNAALALKPSDFCNVGVNCRPSFQLPKPLKMFKVPEMKLCCLPTETRRRKEGWRT
jgi:hypothetical protein